MGGIVEQQIQNAVKALVSADVELAEGVVKDDVRINALEVNIDEECARILARRQPAASDLRLIVAVIKTITDLERIGDEAEKVARMAIDLAEQERPRSQYQETQALGERVQRMVHNALDAFARMDVEAAFQVAQYDEEIDHQYEGILRQLVTHMMEDPRSIKRVMDVIWSVRALERIGDHAKNICEYIIYLVKGKDVRHLGLEAIEKELSPD
jgi:phosphate transport system protein